MRIIHACLLAAAALLGGCAGNPMQVAPTQTIPNAEPNSAQVVFMRSSFVGKIIDASLYDVTGGQTKFIGIMANGSKINYPTTPGKHTFMVVSEAADFLEADLAAGKTYYSVVTPRMGAWKARFSLWPVSSDSKAEFAKGSKEVDNLIKDTELVGNSPKSLSWFENNKGSVEEKRVEYWKVWQEKSAEDLAKRTLHPQDGI
ncbi:MULTISPECIES: hypothetical protein [Pseudomonas]|uniref:hypothetical protein n=1 Tax=Pseudomonas TaxID=286 RepID=UPI002360ABFA|nr:hypothetical protein [Pseudomonas asplenii]